MPQHYLSQSLCELQKCLDTSHISPKRSMSPSVLSTRCAEIKTGKTARSCLVQIWTRNVSNVYYLRQTGFFILNVSFVSGSMHTPQPH